jgi:acetyl esterase/lipase
MSSPHWSRAFACGALAAALCLPAGSAVHAGPPGSTDLAYLADGDPRHRLDLYLPAKPSTGPLVVFVHGGAFMSGDRKMYAPIGQALAAQGFSVAIPSYRLYPQSDAAGAASDVAAAVAWLAGNAASRGLAAHGIVLAGHSAGGQIVALLATHPHFLTAAGAGPAVVRGAFVLAGAYDVRDLSDEPADWQTIDGRIFGPTPEARAAVSPGLDIDAHSPAIVAACGTRDDPGACPRAAYFVHALKAAGVDGTFVRADGADHMGLLARFVDPADPLNRAFVNFVEAAKAAAR